MSNIYSRGSYSLAFQAIMDLMLAPFTNTSGAYLRPAITSPFYRLDDYTNQNGELVWRRGDVHGGIDFNFADPSGVGGLGNNPANIRAVYAPVSGTVVFIDRVLYNTVVIRSNVDGSFHTISHLDSIPGELSFNPPSTVTAGVTSLGNMSNFGVNQAGVSGGATHVHYEVLLNVGSDSWEGPRAENRIDPLVYWTRGVNPTNATSTTGTGLYVYATPVNDVNGNGIIDDPAPGTDTSEIGAVVREGGRSYLKVGVNTPHTRAIELRIEFTNAPAGFRAVDRSGNSAVYWNEEEKAAYVTLPATPVDPWSQGQTIPNTSTIIELHMPEENGDQKNESLTYTVRAGYLVTDTADRNVQNWYDYNQTATIVTPATGNLTVLDNDVSTPPAAVNVLTGDQSQPGYGDDLDANPDTQAIHGLGGDDLLSGHSGENGYVAPIAVYGGTGNDGMYGEYFYTSQYYFLGRDQFFAQGYGNNVTLNQRGSFLFGEAGNDVLLGSLVDDTLDGGADHDYAEGYLGNDTLIGGAGNDILNGDEGHDVVRGDSEVDRLGGGEGSDVLVGGAGSDTLYGDSHFLQPLTWDGMTYVVLEGTGDVQIIPMVRDVLEAEAGADYLEGGAKVFHPRYTFPPLHPFSLEGLLAASPMGSRRGRRDRDVPVAA